MVTVQADSPQEALARAPFKVGDIGIINAVQIEKRPDGQFEVLVSNIEVTTTREQREVEQ